MTFTLEIKLGNDAMQRGRDVARVLRQIAAAINPHGLLNGPFGPVPIRDENGNRVGEWEVR